MAIQFTAVKKRNGKGGRPRSANPKVVLNVRVDRSVLDGWKAKGKGWQIKLNAALKKALED